jgi:DNA-binding NarL/FixJ family response regulator
MQSPGKQPLFCPGGALRVVIAHDADIFCRGLHSFLSTTAGFEVLAEVNSYEGLLKTAAAMPVEIALIDCSLPGGDCIEAIGRLRTLASTPAVVLLVPTLDEELLQRALLNGASGYLTKDTPSHQVIPCLEGLRKGELAMTPRIASVAIRLLVRECYRLAAGLASDRLSTPTTGATNGNHSHAGEEGEPAQPHLTPQEQKILHFLHQGLSNKQIAAQLAISPYTVGKHVQNILRKLGASNRTQAVSHTSFEGPQSRGKR